MILFPAIDLKQGQCVRLQRGAMASAVVFNEDPVDQAKVFANMGFKWLHIVDLDGAFSGNSQNGDVIRLMRASTGASIQVGGGIRTLEAIQAWLDTGIDRVILGTVAVKNPDLVKEACKRFPGRIVLGIDARAGFVAVEGWAEVSKLAASELAQRFADCGAAAIVYTDIERDGMLSGLNIEAVHHLAEVTDIPVIASGGLASMNDIDELSKPKNRKIGGAILGRAYYEGTINAEEARRILESTD